MEETTGPDVASKTESRPSSYGSFLDSMAKSLWLSSGLGFLLSILVNGAVFREWGLNFLQVATPVDVLMAGVHTSFIFIGDIAAAAIAIMLSFATFRYYSGTQPVYFDEYNEFDDGTSAEQLHPIGMKVLNSALLFFGIFLCVGLVQFYFIRIEEGGYILRAVFVFGLLLTCGLTTAYTIGFGYSILKWYSEKKNKHPKLLFFIKYPASFVLLIIGIFAITIPINIIQIMVPFEQKTLLASADSRSYFGAAYTMDGISAECPNARVLWVGERSAVARCDSGEMKVFVGPENLKLSRSANATRPNQDAKIYLPTETDLRGTNQIFDMFFLPAPKRRK